MNLKYFLVLLANIFLQCNIINSMQLKQGEESGPKKSKRTARNALKKANEKSNSSVVVIEPEANFINIIKTTEGNDLDNNINLMLIDNRFLDILSKELQDFLTKKLPSKIFDEYKSFIMSFINKQDLSSFNIKKNLPFFEMGSSGKEHFLLSFETEQSKKQKILSSFGEILQNDVSSSEVEEFKKKQKYSFSLKKNDNQFSFIKNIIDYIFFLREININERQDEIINLDPKFKKPKSLNTIYFGLASHVLFLTYKKFYESLCGKNQMENTMIKIQECQDLDSPVDDFIYQVLLNTIKKNEENIKNFIGSNNELLNSIHKEIKPDIFQKINNCFFRFEKSKPEVQMNKLLHFILILKDLKKSDFQEKENKHNKNILWKSIQKLISIINSDINLDLDYHKTMNSDLLKIFSKNIFILELGNLDILNAWIKSIDLISKQEIPLQNFSIKLNNKFFRDQNFIDFIEKKQINLDKDFIKNIIEYITKEVNSDESWKLITKHLCDNIPNDPSIEFYFKKEHYFKGNCIKIIESTLNKKYSDNIKILEEISNLLQYSDENDNRKYLTTALDIYNKFFKPIYTLCEFSSFYNENFNYNIRKLYTDVIRNYLS